MILITNFSFMLKTTSKRVPPAKKEAACSVHFIIKLDPTFVGLGGLLLRKAVIVYYADRLHSERHEVIRQD